VLFNMIHIADSMLWFHATPHINAHIDHTTHRQTHLKVSS
jgi:hypothetical protein